MRIRRIHSIEQIATAYKMGKLLYLNQISKNEAIKQIETSGMAVNSAKIYLAVHKHLMEGTFSSRTIKAESFDFFLENILKDFGQKYLSNALKALQEHIEYFKRIQGLSKMKKTSSVYEKYAAPHKSLEKLTFPDEEDSFPEGKDIYRLHRSKERNSKLVKQAKTIYIESNPRLECQVCNFSFLEFYGEVGSNYIEAHHIFPISELVQETKTKIDELVFLCSNCHKMIHRKRPWLKPENLKNLLQIT